MKKLIFAMALAAITFVSCDKNDEPNEPVVNNPESTYIDATSTTIWHYFSFSQNKVIGTGEETENATWFARTDWDIAICRYNVRTNSGDATSVNAKGGVATTSGSVLADVTVIPDASNFKTDVAVTTTGMGGVTSTSIYSDATVIQFKKDAEGNMVMPPVYEKSPVYVFRTADGAAYYKVEFTQYLNTESASGHVKFNSAKL